MASSTGKAALLKGPPSVAYWAGAAVVPHEQAVWQRGRAGWV